MKPQRQLLDWIYRMLCLNVYKDFRWNNRKKNIFQLPWPHGSASHWTKEDTALFTGWAQYKGKLKGRENDFKKMKATFRCALNSKKELLEIKSMRTKKLRFWKILSTENKSETYLTQKETKANTKQSEMLTQKKELKKPITAVSSRKSTCDTKLEAPIQTYQNVETPSVTNTARHQLPSFELFRHQMPPSPPREMENSSMPANPFQEQITDKLHPYLDITPEYGALQIQGSVTTDACDWNISSPYALYFNSITVPNQPEELEMTKDFLELQRQVEKETKDLNNSLCLTSEYNGSYFNLHTPPSQAEDITSLFDVDSLQNTNLSDFQVSSLFVDDVYISSTNFNSF